jgi:hypothetical protein
MEAPAETPLEELYRLVRERRELKENDLDPLAIPINLETYALGREEDFEEQNFINSELNGADLRGAVIIAGNFREAKLIGAHLEHAQLPRIRLIGADLQGAHLEHAVLIGANLRDADLSGAFLTNTDLRGANLTGAYITEESLNTATLTPEQRDQLIIIRIREEDMERKRKSINQYKEKTYAAKGAPYIYASDDEAEPYLYKAPDDEALHDEALDDEASDDEATDWKPFKERLTGVSFIGEDYREAKANERWKKSEGGKSKKILCRKFQKTRKIRKKRKTRKIRKIRKIKNPRKNSKSQKKQKP